MKRDHDSLSVEPADGADPLSGKLRRHDNRRLIVDALTRFSPAQRAVICRSHYLGWTTTQIAVDLNMTDSTVKSSLHYALRALARSVGRGDRIWGAPEYPNCPGSL